MHEITHLLNSNKNNRHQNVSGSSLSVKFKNQNEQCNNNEYSVSSTQSSKPKL